MYDCSEREPGDGEAYNDFGEEDDGIDYLEDDELDELDNGIANNFCLPVPIATISLFGLFFELSVPQ